MRGSLSDPPIVYTQPRIWLAVLCVITAYFDYKLVPLFVKLLLATVGRPPASLGLLASIGLILLMFLVLIVLIASLTVFSALRIISPGTLSLSPDGIIWKVGARVRQYDWRLVTNVRVQSSARGGAWIVFDYPDEDTPTGWLWRLNRRLGGTSVALGGWWDASCGEIVDTMQEARKKWYKGTD